MRALDLNNLWINELKKLVKKENNENKKLTGEKQRKNLLKFIKSCKNKTLKYND